MCDNQVGSLAPFCEPVNGSQLAAGSTIDVTWDPNFFSSPDTQLQLHGDLSPASGETEVGREGFVTESIRAGDGSYSWEILETYLENGNAMQASIYLVVDNTTGDTEQIISGPTVQLVPAPASSGPNAAAIAVPVIVGPAFLGAVGWWWWRRRRQGRGVLPRSAGAGYGVKKSRSERMGPQGAGGAVRMATMGDGASPQDGRNVFREEMRRQQAMT